MKRLGLRVGLVVLVLIVPDLVFTFLYLSQVNRYAEELQRAKSDVGIVLFSDFEAESLAPETLRRVRFAEEMFKEGAFDYIVCAGGARPKRNLYGSELMRQWLLASGVPPDHVFLEKRSNDTRSNLDEGLKVVSEKGWRTASVVSSPLHIFRVKEITEDMGESVSIFLAAYSYRDCHPPIDWTTLWWQTHYEWAACLVPRILPRRIYDSILDRFRG
jgi:uncharacterized SAM-binding protein YcdF (DUF218 family)